MLLRLASASLCAISLFAQTPQPASAKPDPNDPWQSGTFSSLRLRPIGPALMSGRVNQVVVHPNQPATWYAGVASGGVWKTTNAGATWTPIFQNEGAYSIGDVVLDPRDPNTIWVGTGEHNNQRSVGWGDGVYRSADGGRTWKNVGLKDSQHIGRIAIDPRDSSVVYAAAQGPLWSPGGDRGLYKTIDGGKTWTQVLKISDNTGVTDVAIDPSNPDVILAAAHQRRRHVWTLIHGGPESALYKSTDAGKTWRKLTTGLPSGELGRIGLAFSPARKGLVYASVEAAEGSGTYRSLDSGESWEKRSDLIGQAMYYAHVIPDPNVADRLYTMTVVVQVSNDGGRTWSAVGERAKHVDTHDYWIDPKDSDHIIAGCDGGIYESWDRGRLWRHITNLSVTQFYNVDVDNASPIYNVYGGTQDNSTLGGPSRTRGVDGATNADWFIVTGGDGFVARIDPKDPDTVYGESQYGGLVRLNRRTAERVPIKPVEGKGEPALRFNWESPYIISPHLNTRLYFGANRLFRSDDRGNSWTAISPDLTRRVDRNKLPVMGRIWPPEAIAKDQSTSTWGNLTALSESPKKAGLIYTGSDDGLISVTEDDGKTWRKIEKIPALPDLSTIGPIGVYVQRLAASRHDVNTVYALFDNHKNGDFKPYILKSTDKGATWTSIAGNLPANGPALAFAEDHVNPNLLFCGTEFGLFFTTDGGQKWIRFRGLPTIAVRDLAIQERENDLVAATFGRGLYILDDYTPLRLVKSTTFESPAQIFPIKKATIFVQDSGRSRGSQGEQLFMAENPPFGATFTYWLKDTLKTKKQTRVSNTKKDSSDYPTQAQLTAEADEEAPQVILTITGPDGKVVKRLTGPTARGIHRVTWNLRGPAAAAGAGMRRRSGDDDDEGGQSFSGGAFVPPGTYKVALAQRVDGVLTSLGAEQSFIVEADPAAQVKPEDRKALSDFVTKVYRLQRQVTGSLEAANTAKTRLAAMRRALLDSSADAKYMDTASSLDRRLTAILRKLRGDETLRGLESGSPSTIQSRVSSAAYGIRNLTGAPTGTQQMNYQIASEEFAAEKPRLEALLADLKKFESELDAAGVPYTQGRYQ